MLRYVNYRLYINGINDIFIRVIFGKDISVCRTIQLDAQNSEFFLY